MELSVWARQQGIFYRAAWNLFKNGQLPVPAMQLATDLIVDIEKPLSLQSVALYARLPSSDQKNDLGAQLGRLSAETGSGLNGHCPKLLVLLAHKAQKAMEAMHG